MATLTPTAKPALMSFDEAIRKVIDGKRINREEWGDKRIYYLLKDGLLQLHKAGESEDVTHPFVLNDGDLLGIDWVVLPEGN